MLCLSACSSLSLALAQHMVMCRTLIFTLLEADVIFPACSDGIFMLSKIACDDCNLVRRNEPEHCGQTSVSERGTLTTTQWTNARPHWPIVNAAWWTQMSLSLGRHTWRTERNTDSDEGLLQSRNTQSMFFTHYVNVQWQFLLHKTKLFF